MLSLSYDYDVLSLGLLKNQARSIEVHLKELQSGCLANMNSSCQDIAIANALMGITRNLTSSKLPNKREGVVCFRILQEFSLGIGGGFKYISAVLQENMVTTVRFTVIWILKRANGWQFSTLSWQ